MNQYHQPHDFGDSKKSEAMTTMTIIISPVYTAQPASAMYQLSG